MEFIVTQDKSFLKSIPHEPGVYRFYAATLDSHEELLYIGKAINLAKRIKSYFQSTASLSPRISLMVNKIDKIILTVTDNEASALILENNLIKSQKPKYNIVFRDDKSYPLIRLSKHDFPRIDSYRGKSHGDNYFGPYSNVQTVRQALDMIQTLFKLRTCSDNFFKSRQTPCMLYQIKRCTAPCVGYVTVEEYKAQVELARQFLKGNYTTVINILTNEMYQKAESLEFESAALIRDKISALNQVSTKQIVTNHNHPVTTDIVMAQVIQNKKQTMFQVFVYVISIKNGVYSSDNNFCIKSNDADLSHALEAFLEGYYLEHRHTSVVYVDTKLDSEFLQMFYAATKIKVIISSSDWVKKLFDMAKINLDKIIENYHEDLDEQLLNGAKILADLLKIPTINRIECIDISHNNGVNAVASLVVYEDGKIDSSKYRLYNLPDTVNGDDLLGLKTMLSRRFKSDNLPLPNVILVDGGMNQYKAVKKLITENDLCDRITLASIYKGAKRDPKYDRVIVQDGVILSANDNPELFKLLQGLRDEAHRFAITRHRKKQVKTMAVSKLTEIPGVGEAKRRALVAHFGGMRGVMYASVNELKKVYGVSENLADQIYTYFHS